MKLLEKCFPCVSCIGLLYHMVSSASRDIQRRCQASLHNQWVSLKKKRWGYLPFRQGCYTQKQGFPKMPLPTSAVMQCRLDTRVILTRSYSFYLEEKYIAHFEISQNIANCPSIRVLKYLLFFILWKPFAIILCYYLK